MAGKKVAERAADKGRKLVQVSVPANHAPWIKEAAKALCEGAEPVGPVDLQPRTVVHVERVEVEKTVIVPTIETIEVPIVQSVPRPVKVPTITEKLVRVEVPVMQPVAKFAFLATFVAGLALGVLAMLLLRP